STSVISARAGRTRRRTGPDLAFAGAGCRRGVEAGAAPRADAARDEGGRGGTSAADGMLSSRTSTAAMDKPIPSDETRCHVVLTTLPSREAAETIARALVEARLAACVQLVDG